MGGSICKALKAGTSHEIWGLDRDIHVVAEALAAKAIDREIGVTELKDADVTFVCLYPQSAIGFMLDHAGQFKKNGIVADICGVKEVIVRQVMEPLASHGVVYIGTHPMAGRECSGFGASLSTLFVGASLILTPTDKTPEFALDCLRDLASGMGFGQVVLSTPKEHDRIIAYTSQLAHVVSSAYVKSGSLKLEQGFSAGSFQDMTRVAKLDEEMWNSLFAMNRENLLWELDNLLKHLEEYRDALKAEDEEKMRALLREGRILKERSMANQKLRP